MSQLELLTGYEELYIVGYSRIKGFSREIPAFSILALISQCLKASCKAQKARPARAGSACAGAAVPQAGGAGARCRGAGQLAGHSRPRGRAATRLQRSLSPQRPSVPLQALGEEEGAGAGAGTRRLPPGRPRLPPGRAPEGSAPLTAPSRPVPSRPRPRGAHRQAELQVLLRQQQQEPPRRHPPRRRHLGTAPASPPRMRRRAGMAGTARPDPGREGRERKGREGLGAAPQPPARALRWWRCLWWFVAVPGPCLPELPR